LLRRGSGAGTNGSLAAADDLEFDNGVARAAGSETPSFQTGHSVSGRGPCADNDLLRIWRDFLPEGGGLASVPQALGLEAVMTESIFKQDMLDEDSDGEPGRLTRFPLESFSGSSRLGTGDVLDLVGYPPGPLSPEAFDNSSPAPMAHDVAAPTSLLRGAAF